MAVQPWRLYNLAKKKIGNATINLSATTYRMALYKGTSAASTWATLTKSLYVSITGQVANGNGYLTSGQSLATETWTVGASAGSYRFNVADPTWTATGGAITNIGGAVMFVSAASGANQHLLLRASLATTPFTVEQGNTITIQMNALGVFTMA